MPVRDLPAVRPVHPCLLNNVTGTVGVEYATWASFVLPGGGQEKKKQKCLVTAQASSLKVFSYLRNDTATLEEEYSFPHIAGTICHLSTLPSPVSTSTVDCDDALLLGFGGQARMAICYPKRAAASSGGRLILEASTLIDFTSALMEACMGSVTPLDQDVMLTVLKKQRKRLTVAAVLGGGVAVVCLELHFSGGIWQALGEPHVLPLTTLSKVLQHSSSSPSSSSGGGSAGGGKNAPSAHQLSISHGFGDILDVLFLEAYNEPTLVVLHGQPTCSGRLGEITSNGIEGGLFCTAISITVLHETSAVLWSVRVPSDALELHPLVSTATSGGDDGVLVKCVNGLFDISAQGQVSKGALAVNGWARSTLSTSPSPYCNPWPLPKLSIQLDGSCISMMTNAFGILCLRYGQLFTIQKSGGYWSILPTNHLLSNVGEISSMLTTLPTPADQKLLKETKQSTDNPMSMGFIFCGSRLGDSSLLGYTLEHDVPLIDVEVKKANRTDEANVVKSDLSTPMKSNPPQEEDEYDVILRAEEDALYATDDENDEGIDGTAQTSRQQPVNVIVPSEDEEENPEELHADDSSLKAKRSPKRVKLVRMNIIRSISTLDSMCHVGPLGPGCQGPLKKGSTSLHKVLPCGYGSSGGLALLTAPGHDDRVVLAEQDCLNVESVHALSSGILLMGMLPDKDDSTIAGINAMLIESDGSDTVRLSQVDKATWIQPDPDAMVETVADALFVFAETQLLGASDIGDNMFGMIIRALNDKLSYAFCTFARQKDNTVRPVSQSTLSTGFPSTMLQVTPFLKTSEGSTMFGCVWSMGCATVYTIDDEGTMQNEETIDGFASLVEAADDDEEIFYQSNRITAIDIFHAPGDLFDIRHTNTPSVVEEEETVRIVDEFDDDDGELYNEENEMKGSEDSPIQAVPQNLNAAAETQVFVMVARQNGDVQVFNAGQKPLGESVWESMGCGFGNPVLTPTEKERPRHPRSHKAFAREIRFFRAGPSRGSGDYYVAVLTNLGDLHTYKVVDAHLIRTTLRLPTRPSKKQSEHHTKLRRRKILPSNTVDGSVFNSKEYHTNELSRFVDLSGQDGLFSATTRPLWFVTERRALVALSHRCRHVAPSGGRARPVSGFCTNMFASQKVKAQSGFLTLHERIGRVGSQRLTFFKGISNLFSPYGAFPGGGFCLEKIPMGVTVHRVQFIDHPDVSLYALLISRDIEVDQGNLNDDGLTEEERKRIAQEKEEEKLKRQVEKDLGGFDDNEWVEKIEREDCFELDTELGGASPIKKSAFSVWIVDAANKWMVVDSFELAEFEHGTALEIMRLTEVNVDPGSNSSLGDHIGGEKLFIAIGTSIVDGDGEDVTAKGRVLLFEVKPFAEKALMPGDPVAELSLTYEKDVFHGPVTSLSCLTTEGISRLVIGAGADVNVEQWGMDRMTQVGFFRATMQILDIKLFKNFFILSDAYDSIYFLVWRESDKSLTLLAKDYEPIAVFAAGLMSRGAAMTLVCHDDRQNLQFFQYAPGDPAARGGNKLVNRADVHLGTQTIALESHYCRSSILVNSATPGSTYAALKSQDSLFGRPDDDQRLGVHFGTCDGGIGTVLPLNEPDYWRLAALQSVMANALESDCAMNPRAWRLYRRSPRRGGCRNNDRRKGVIDGDLIIQYCDLTTADQEDLASAVGSTVELILDNLLELHCSSMII